MGLLPCQNEAELTFSMEIDHHNSSTEQAGKIRQTDFPCLFCGWDLMEISIGNYTSASFWQRIAPTAPFNTWDKRITLLQLDTSFNRCTGATPYGLQSWKNKTFDITHFSALTTWLYTSTIILFSWVLWSHTKRFSPKTESPCSQYKPLPCWEYSNSGWGWPWWTVWMGWATINRCCHKPIQGKIDRYILLWSAVSRTHVLRQTCDELYHFTFCTDRFGIPLGSQPIRLP